MEEINNFEELLSNRHSCRNYNPDKPISIFKIEAIKYAIKRSPFASGGPRLEYFTIENPERRALEMKENIGAAVVNEFNKAEKGLLQVLIHPEHWEFKE